MGQDALIEQGRVKMLEFWYPTQTLHSNDPDDFKLLKAPIWRGIPSHVCDELGGEFPDARIVGNITVMTALADAMANNEPDLHVQRNDVLSLNPANYLHPFYCVECNGVI